VASPTSSGSGGVPVLSPNATSSAARCGGGQPLDPSQHRSAQLVKRRIRELHLGLDAEHPCDAEPRRMFDRVIEQRRLADACLAAQHKRSAALFASVIQEALDRLDLDGPVPAAWKAGGRTVGHRPHGRREP